MSVKIASPAHEVCYQDLCKLVAKHANELTKIDVLAIAANMVGKLVAMQDQREYSAAHVLEVVAQNIERGNQHVLENLANKTAGSS